MAIICICCWALIFVIKLQFLPALTLANLNPILCVNCDYFIVAYALDALLELPMFILSPRSMQP